MVFGLIASTDCTQQFRDLADFADPCPACRTFFQVSGNLSSLLLIRLVDSNEL